jgi:hypothetical protein
LTIVNAFDFAFEIRHFESAVSAVYRFPAAAYRLPVSPPPDRGTSRLTSGDGRRDVYQQDFNPVSDSLGLTAIFAAVSR